MTSNAGYVVLRCPLGLPSWRVPLCFHDESGRTTEGQTSVGSRNTVEAEGLSRQQELEKCLWGASFLAADNLDLRPITFHILLVQDRDRTR